MTPSRRMAVDKHGCARGQSRKPVGLFDSETWRATVLVNLDLEGVTMAISAREEQSQPPEQTLFRGRSFSCGRFRVLILLSCCGALFWLEVRPDARLPSEDIKNHIQVGMTEVEVERVLGP